MTKLTRIDRQYLTRRGWKAIQVRGNDWVWSHDRYKRNYSRDEAIERERKFSERIKVRSER
jgi:hypothetical protein